MTKILSITILAGIIGTCPAQTGVVTDAAETSQKDTAQHLPEGERRLRRGLILLGSLCQCMAGVRDYNSAEAAVPQIMRLCEELQQWSQSFSNLPPLSEVEVQVYEDRYLPTIRKINQVMETQADRLGAAEYYGSRNLPAVLVRVAQIGQD